jgi:hypothetical protein
MKSWMLFAGFALSAGLAHATLFTECPAVGAETGCYQVIIVSSTGAVSVTNGTLANGTTPQPFSDEFLNPGDQDDTVVGLINNWTGHSITSITLTGTDAFDFAADAGNQDNPCSTLYTTLESEPHATGCNSGGQPNDYARSGDTITVTNVNSGKVTFGTALAPGSSNSSFTWFGLEGAITGTPTITTTTAGVPEPGSLMLLGSGLLGAGLIGRFRRRKS